MRPQLVLLGDSITEKGSQWENDGWVCLLLNRFNRSADICQRGMGGYTTRRFMEVVYTTLSNDLGASLNPQLITLWLGANDAALPDGPGKGQHVPLDEYSRNLHTFVKLFKHKAPQAKIILITPPAVDDSRRGGDRSNAAAGQYAKACVQVAKDERVESIDLWTLFNALPETEWKSMLSDGLHLTKKGNTFMEKQLVGTIEAKFPDLDKKLKQIEFPLLMDNGQPPPVSVLDAQVTWWKWLIGA